MRTLGPLGLLMTSLLALGGCKSAPPPKGGERLDQETGTTLAVIGSPVELIAETRQAGTNDPFTYVAPFQTNQMGQRTAYLWVATPALFGATGLPRVHCDATLLELTPISGGSSEIGLSDAPYPAPTPWSVQWYFRIPMSAVSCLSGAQRLEIRVPLSEGAEELFSSGADRLAPLREFVAQLETN